MIICLLESHLITSVTCVMFSGTAPFELFYYLGFLGWYKRLYILSPGWEVMRWCSKTDQFISVASYCTVSPTRITQRSDKSLRLTKWNCQGQTEWNTVTLQKTDKKGLVPKTACRDSLWANEEPVQPYPCQQQHDNSDGQAQEEPLPKVNAVAVWINPKSKKWTLERNTLLCVFLFSTFCLMEPSRTHTHWFRYSEKMRLGEVPGSVVIPPMFEA